MNLSPWFEFMVLCCLDRSAAQDFQELQELRMPRKNIGNPFILLNLGSHVSVALLKSGDNAFGLGRLPCGSR
jgi:hypothetical protein